MTHSSELGPFMFESEVPLRWGDMDQLGHVNNTVYFRCFEQARTEWIDQYPESIDSNPAYVVIIHTECTFLKELKAPGVALIKAYVGKRGRSSLVQHYTLSRTDEPDTIYATGSAKLVWVDPETGKSTEIPTRFSA